MKQVPVLFCILVMALSSAAQQTEEMRRRGLSDRDFPRIHKLTETVYAYEMLRAPFQGARFTTNNLVVITTDGILVADAQGSPEDTARLIEEIKKLSAQPIKYVVIGSEHADHTGGNASFPATLSFTWGRDVPTLYLVAENDTSLPLAGMYEIFDRTPATKQMLILRRADHAHFMDDVEQLHESFRTMPVTGDLARIQKEMQPIAELCSGKQAHLIVRGLTLCHIDAILRGQKEAQRFLRGDIEAELAERGVDVIAHKA